MRDYFGDAAIKRERDTGISDVIFILFDLLLKNIKYLWTTNRRESDVRIRFMRSGDQKPWIFVECSKKISGNDCLSEMHVVR